MKLLQVDTVDQVKEKMDLHFADVHVGFEEVHITDAMDRTAYEDIASRVDIPDFDRSTVDGYAVQAKDTFGAGESLPVFLQVMGQVLMGSDTRLSVSPGQCVYVPTGGMIPQSADAMLMIEYVENLDSRTIAAYTAISPGDYIIRKGDDVKQGGVLLSKGRRIRAQDIAVLAAAGVERIKVYCKPRVAVISTGDEIVDPFGPVDPGQIRDINTYVLAAMAQALGAQVTSKSLVRDDFELLKAAVAEAVKDNHIVLLSGGSSVGVKDNTEKVLDSFGQQGVFVHGVAVKPGKPTIIGKIGNTAVFGLPGHPVSAMTVFKVFVEYLIDRLQARTGEKLSTNAICTTNLHASPGKETYQMVELQESSSGYEAKPIHAKSAAVSHLTRAHGFIRIPLNKEGIKKGEAVKVELLP